MSVLSPLTVLSLHLDTSVCRLYLVSCFIQLLDFLVQIKQPQTLTGAELH